MSPPMRPRPRCHDCKGPYSIYQVHDAVWLEAFPSYPRDVIDAHARGEQLLLCFDCLERRLGRFLGLSDFPECIANSGVFFGYRLRSRTP